MKKWLKNVADLGDEIGRPGDCKFKTNVPQGLNHPDINHQRGSAHEKHNCQCHSSTAVCLHKIKSFA